MMRPRFPRSAVVMVCAIAGWWFAGTPAFASPIFGPSCLLVSPFQEGNTTFSQSCSWSNDGVSFATNTVREDEYATRLTAQLDGGAILYDMLFFVPYSDPIVQSAILEAQAVLAAASLESVSFVGPTLLGTSELLLDSLVSSDTIILNQQSFFSTTETTGPATVIIGDLGDCASFDENFNPVGCDLASAIGSGNAGLFAVEVGTVNFHTNTHVLASLLQTDTTTNRYRVTETYNLVATVVPEPTTLALLSAGVGALFLVRRKR